MCFLGLPLPSSSTSGLQGVKGKQVGEAVKVTQLQALEIEGKGLRAAWPPPVGWSFRPIREAGTVQGSKANSLRVYALTHADMLSPSPHGTWGSPFLYAELWKYRGPDTAWVSVDLGKKVGFGDSQSWFQFTVDKLLNPSWLHCPYP